MDILYNFADNWSFTVQINVNLFILNHCCSHYERSFVYLIDQNKFSNYKCKQQIRIYINHNYNEWFFNVQLVFKWPHINLLHKSKRNKLIFICIIKKTKKKGQAQQWHNINKVESVKWIFFMIVCLSEQKESFTYF